MLYIYLLLALILFLIIFVFAPAAVCYRSVFGRRKTLPLDSEKLYKPAIEPYKKRMIADYDALQAHDCRRLTVTAYDGVKLCGDYYDRGAQKTAILIHGYNADPYVNLVSPAKWLFDEGFNVLVICHRAHGDSGGDRCGMGLIEKNDVLTWLRYVLDDNPRQYVLLYGMSMGGTTLSYLCDTIDEPRVPCMVIDCGYISTENQLRHDAKRMHMPPLLIPLIRRFGIWDQHIDIRERSVDHLKNAKIPILFIHGTADLTVPIEEGKRNFTACSSEKRMVIVEGGGHTTAFQTNEKQVAAEMEEFLRPYFK